MAFSAQQFDSLKPIMFAVQVLLKKGASPLFLTKPSQQDGALLLVLVAKVLAVADLLLPGPAPHLQTTNKSEDDNTPVQLASQVDTQPSNDLKHIVGASDKVEPEALGNATLSGTRTTEAAQNQVSIEVEDLAQSEQSKTGIQKGGIGLGRGGGGVRTEDPVGDVETGQSPVVRAVLEDVPGGHGGVAEAVHKDGFILTLQEVQGQEGAD